MALQQRSSRNSRNSRLAGAFALALIGVAAAPVAAADALYSYVSQAGDYIGAGQSKVYTHADSTITVSGNAQALSMNVRSGVDNWRIDLAAPQGQKFQRGRYYYAERSAFRTGLSPGIDIGGNGRGCNETWGSVYIQQIEFDANGAVTALEATALQRCERETAPLLAGVLRYNVQPLALSLDSDVGDYIGGGIKKSYAGDTSVFALQGNNRYLTYAASGQRDDWMAFVQAPTGKTLAPGTYPIARFADTVRMGFDFGGNGRGCNRISGTATIKKIEVDPVSGLVTQLLMDFEQHCEAGVTALRGTLRYKA
ncbi:hypothetical protein [Lysobacter antibioticus]|uniref:hypothetical protein n=1 Tax=Lysobacter antibioticus TaxID=84531 RepID=UPI0021BD60EC|nr:hypothetical protein [Lysobacter antibioticus]